MWLYLSDTPWEPTATTLLIIGGVGLAAGIAALSIRFTKASLSLSAFFPVHFLLSGATIMLIYATGSLVSVFFPLWMIIALGAQLASTWSTIGLAIIGNLIAIPALLSGDITSYTILTLVLINAPLLIGLAGFARYNTSHERQHIEPIDRSKPHESTKLSRYALQSEGIANAIGDGVIMIDTEGIIRFLNPAGAQILGWSQQDSVNLHYKSILKLFTENGDPIPDTADPVQQTMTSGSEHRSTILLAETQAGKKRNIGIVITPVDNKKTGVIVAFRDITKEKQEEHQQAEFISTASHEMRTPVASIEGYLGLALNPATATIDAKARDYITKAHESAQHLGRLFQDLLDVSKAEDGRLSNNPVVLDMGEYVGSIVEGLQSKATAKGLTLQFAPSVSAEDEDRRINPVYFAHLDKDHVRELVSNLTENAIKYTPSGSVTVDITGTADKLVISVTDSGIGIPAEDIPHLFQKFYRVDNTDTREIGGTGLGLYLCRRLAETMSGRIWAESTYKKGSTFFVELPRLSGEQARLLEQQAQQSAVNTPPPSAPVSTPVTPPPTPPTPLTAHQATPPAPQPQPYTQPQYGAAAPQPQQTPTPEQPLPQDPANIPLSYIEQAPSLYTQARRASVAIPDRSNNQGQQ